MISTVKSFSTKGKKMNAKKMETQKEKNEKISAKGRKLWSSAIFWLADEFDDLTKERNLTTFLRLKH